jgi:hypothetical protein
MGIVLGCGSTHASPRSAQAENPTEQQRNVPKGATRLLQILLSEAAHLIWVLRCERAIQDHNHSPSEISNRWYRAINTRLTDDKITATKIKRDKASVQMVKNTWEHVLRKHSDLPEDWITSREVLVGSRARHALAPVGLVP